ncbi:uncharacterized protein LOC131073985 isoform X1 [Cryptomeria japonica]|uniref:uncharacterized protein LOC131073985 isoform X1 n=1 Tax=Cryptomeria japonica TaxID=3369 RepID=UPI0025AC10D4|nr:uncharacterized protein LOC131073985 isoform X1 [Cryptomeria japonica]XP_057866512.1 uncharacterized protein LOC131073985 isoform X1 [Cryptomeria japonica]
MAITLANLASLSAGVPSMAVSSTSKSDRKPLVERAVIVGGGLGGLSAAIQLRKMGIDAHVYDKYQRLSGGEGTMISIFPNGCKVLNHADPIILDKMKEVGKIDMLSLGVTPQGDRVSEWRLSSHMEETYGQPLIAILWQDALKILADALPEECKHTGYECFNISQGEEGATVHFKREDETISIEAPLIIGADGIHSTTRKILFGAVEPRDNGRTMWRAVIDRSLCSHKALVTGTLASMQNGRTTFIINGVKDKLYWALSVTDECTQGETKIRSRSKEEAKERLLKYFEGWDVATHVIQATDPEFILERRVLDVPVLPKWSCGHVILLGANQGLPIFHHLSDAAHAVTPSYGQGANLAFEDGLELAKQLTISSDLRSAFEAYEKARIPRASIISEKSQSIGVRPTDEFYNWLYTAVPES